MSGFAKQAPNWEDVLASLCHFQQLLPEAVVVGGTASALHAGHRVSFDHDHVLADLKNRYQEVLADLEAAVGWETRRLAPPVPILGNFEGIQTGVRQLRRSAPLETTTIDVGGCPVRLPTVPELLRIKAFLALERNKTRDYLDIAALVEKLGAAQARTALRSMDTLYPQRNGDPYAVRVQLIRQLADPRPADLDREKLGEYRAIKPPFDSWDYVEGLLQSLSADLLEHFSAEWSNEASPEGAAAGRALADRREARARGDSPSVPGLPGLQR